MPKKQRQLNKKKQQRKTAVTAKSKASSKADQHGVDSSAPEGETESKSAALESLSKSATAVPCNQVTGLVNLGHTCYFNAAIQVLLTSKHVQDFYLQPARRGPLGSGLHEVAKAFADETSPAKVVSEAGRKRKGSQAAFTPRKLHSAVQRIAPHLKTGEEQDSHELLRILLNGLQEEEAKAQESNECARGQEGIDEEEAANFIKQAFEAQLASRIECLACPHVATKFEDFMDISVEIPRSLEQEDALSGLNNTACGNARGKKARKARKPFIVPEARGSKEPALESAKRQRKQAKQAKKAADQSRKQQRKRSSRASSAAPSEADPVLEEEAAQAQVMGRADPQKLAEMPAIVEPPVLAQDTAPPLEEAESLSDEHSAYDFSTGSSTLPSPNTYGSLAASSCQEAVQGSPRGDAHLAATLTADKRQLLQKAEGNALIQGQSGSRELPLACSLEDSSADSKPPADGYHPLPSHPEPATLEPRGLQECQESLSMPLQSNLASDRSEAASSSVLDSEAPISRLPSPETGLKEEAIDDKYSDLWEQSSSMSDAEKYNKAGKAEQSIEDGAEESQPFGCLFDAPEEPVIAADSAGGSLPSTPSSAAHGMAIEGCLAAFFSPEEVMWECPGESRKVLSEDQGLGLSANMPRSVSFSDQKPSVRLVPGSEEQRGTEAHKALRGKDSFRRSFKVGEACLQVTAEVDSMSANVMHLTLHPNAFTDATLELIQRPISVSDVAIPAVQDPDDEVEQDLVAQKALLLLNCIVDMVLHEGVEGMQKMVERGMELKPRQWPTSVCGILPEELGGGTWEYPLTTPPTPAPGATLSKRDSYLSCQNRSPSAALRPGCQPHEEEPDTPAANSITSFETVDLDGSPIRRQTVTESLDSPSKPAGEGSNLFPSPMISSATEYLSAASAALGGNSEVAGGVNAAEASTPLGSPSSGPSIPHSAGNCTANVETQGQIVNGNATPHLSSEDAAKAHLRENGTVEQPGAREAVASAPSAAASVANSQLESPQSSQNLPLGSEAGSSEGDQRHSEADFVTPAKRLSLDLPSRSPSGSSILRKQLRSGLKNPQRKANKGYLIYRAPLLLTVHLKRFQADMRGRAKKINGQVEFGLDLDISPWCDPQGIEAAGAQYSLLGVVVHAGNSMRTGHYYAYVRRPLKEPLTRNSNNALGSEMRSGTDPEPDQMAPAHSNPRTADSSSQANCAEDALAAAHASDDSADQLSSSDPPQLSKAVQRTSLNPENPNETPENQCWGWFYVSDRTVKAVSMHEVLQAEAYILFYQRK